MGLDRLLVPGAMTPGLAHCFWWLQRFCVMRFSLEVRLDPTMSAGFSTALVKLDKSWTRRAPPLIQFTMGAFSELNCPRFRDGGEMESVKRRKFLNEENWVVSRGEEIVVGETRTILSSATLHRLVLA